MRPQRTNPRQDYHRQENQRVQDSVNLAEKFKGLKSLTAELAYFNPDGVTKHGEIKYTYNPDTTKSVVRFDCSNYECVQGDFDLSEALAQAFSGRRTSVSGEMCCQGWRSRATVGEIRCHHLLRYKLKLAYKRGA